MTNMLYYGDNLPVLREHVPDESVDLIYLDPPFNSNANYSILFKSPEGHSSDAQIEAFEDTWHWNESAEQAFDEVMKSGNIKAFDLLNAMRSFLGENDMMAYLAMMAVRLLELHRVLRPTGSLYLHCDPTAGHYLKLLLDGVFGKEQFLNEISWKRTFAHGSAKRFGPVHDIIFFYSKNGHNRWQDLKIGHDDSYVSRHFRYHDTARGESFQAISLTGAGVRKGESGQSWRNVDPTKVGRHWAIPRAILDKEELVTTGTISALEALDGAGRIYWPAKDGGTPRLKWFVSDLDGARLGDVWTDIPPISAQAKERLGYPTQKPLALLERIIAASTVPGDVVLDPFCGCGTAVHAAQKLGRQWLGIDVTHLAVSLIEKRMKDAFPGLTFTVEGRPQDLAAAQYLASRNKNEFEKWAVTALDGIPYRTGQGADGGIDGIIYFNGWDGAAQKVLKEKAIISVKGGSRKGVGMVSELVETIARQKAAVGVLFMAALPTREMESRAAAAGTYDLGEYGRYPRIQIITLAEFFNQGKRPRLPNIDRTSNRVAKREEPTRQNKLL